MSSTPREKTDPLPSGGITGPAPSATPINAPKRKSWTHSGSPTPSQSLGLRHRHARDSTISAKPLTPVSPTQALDYLKGIGGHPPALRITYQRDDGQRGKPLAQPGQAAQPRMSLATAGNYGGLTRWTRPAPTAVALAEGEKDAAILAAAGLIAFTAPRGAQSLPSGRLR